MRPPSFKKRSAAFLLLGLILAQPALAVDVSQLSAFEHDPCFVALAQRNTDQHVGAPDNALADACDRTHGNIEAAWDLVQRLWKPAEITAGVPSNRLLSPVWTVFGLVGMLLSYAALGWPLRSLVTLFRSTLEGRTRGALGAEAGLSLVLRLAVASVFLLVLRVPFMTAFGALVLLIRLLRTGRPAAPPLDSAPASALASTLALTSASVVNDAAGTVFGLLALALFAQGNVLLLVIGVAISVPFSLAVVAQAWRRVRRRPLVAGAVSGLLAAGVAVLALRDPPLAHGIAGSFPLLAVFVPLTAALVVTGLATRTLQGSAQVRSP